MMERPEEVKVDVDDPLAGVIVRDPDLVVGAEEPKPEARVANVVVKTAAGVVKGSFPATCEFFRGEGGFRTPVL
ncbi:hypothetical protein NDU88_005621 [Pleurodeles waltl]|uniref:Uncharacterized protein n=1 Tax=Pleurodeles waltl TaxID=8319 RepID=A0AAV7UK24_PLEWA|nr:hypothetical protein NDU88_005621 [Pleurodeles waltl]